MSVTTLKEISEMAARLEAAAEARRALEAQLTDAKANERRLATETLPEMMREVGLTEIKLSSGAVVSVVEEVAVNIPAARRAEAHEWLCANGFGGLIKTRVTVEFDRGEVEEAIECASKIREMTEHDAGVEETVHPATLKSFAKEQLSAGAPLPTDLFGFFPYAMAKVRLPKG